MHLIKAFLYVFCMAWLVTSCVVVKEYDKVYINDPDMALVTKKYERFKTDFQVYREAASGANGGKTGGGCGCN